MALMDLPAWVPEIETKPAPMPLLVVQSFVNTWEADTGVELLADPVAAGLWLREAGLISTAGDHSLPDPATLRGVREAIRSLLVHNRGDAVPSEGDVSALRQAAAGCRLRPALDGDGRIDIEADDGDREWVSRLLLIIRDAQRDGTWGRLKACRNPDCEWAFYDRSHAGRGTWCDMAVCGNRIKNRNLRSRRAAAGAGEHPGGPG
jgi:predicted RNA-binding Zn ribbon-like protein